jgi:hypothetical protein
MPTIPVFLFSQLPESDHGNLENLSGDTAPTAVLHKYFFGFFPVSGAFPPKGRCGTTI